MSHVADTLEKSLWNWMENKKEKQKETTKLYSCIWWEYTGNPSEAILHREELQFNDIELKQRSYK